MAINRREFLLYSITAGAVYCSERAFALPSYDGYTKRTDIVDVHHHILPEVYISSLAKRGITSTNGAPFPPWSVQRSIDAMDRNGIQKAITSISAPGIFFADMEAAIRLARQCNEFSANLIAHYSGRFGAFGVLPLPDVEAALVELAYILDILKLDGVVLLSNINGEYLGSPYFDDLLAELNRRKAVVFIHPTEPSGKQFPKMAIPPSFFEFLFETTRTVANLILHNTLERYPYIRFIAAHGGGTAPYLTKKMALTAQISGRRGDQAISQLEKIYYDTALSTSRYSLALLKELAGIDRIVFGSDFGFAPEYVMISSIYDMNHSDVFGGEDLQKIYRENALQMFSRLHG